MKSNGAMTLYSRNRKILYKRFPYIVKPLRDLEDGTVIDGEPSRSMAMAEQSSVC